MMKNEEIYKLPEGVRIVDVINLQITEKDIIEIERFADFLYLLGGQLVIYRMGKTLYLLADSYILTYKINKGLKSEEEQR